MKNAEETLGKKAQTGCADAGYSSVDDLENVEDKMNVIVPTAKQTNEERHGVSGKRFEKSEFDYFEPKDFYYCPTGKILKPYQKNEDGDTIYKANAKECRRCRFFCECTKSRNGRTKTRLKNEKIKERLEKNYMQAENKEIYKRRKEKAELPFGHIKRNLGAGQFLLRGKHKVNAEVALFATSFNIARMITLLGAEIIGKASGLKAKLEKLFEKSMKVEIKYA